MLDGSRVFAVVAAFAVSAHAAVTNVIGTLNLTSDQTIDLVADETTVVSNLTGGAHTLTVQGTGRLVVHNFANPDARLVVGAGATLEGRCAVPAVCARAFFHVDACATNTLTFSLGGGTNLVSKWTDVRGGDHVYASARSGMNMPYVTTCYFNGRDVMDFGSIKQSNGGLQGWGGTLAWSTRCARPIEVFMVAGDTLDAKASINGNGGNQHRNNALFGTTDSSSETGIVGFRGNGATGETCELLNGSSLLWKNAKMNSFTVDGTANINPTTYRLPDGMHVISCYATNEAYIDGTGSADVAIDAFAAERSYYEQGGLRFGEYIVFTNVLSAAERAEVNGYLEGKWRTEQKVASLTLAAGAKVALPDGMNLVVNDIDDAGGIVTGPGRLTAAVSVHRGEMVLTDNVTIDVPADVTYTVESLSGYAWRLTKTGEGTLAIRNMASDKVKLTVAEGTFTIPSFGSPSEILPDAFFHVDASSAASFTTETRNGTNFVTRWNDVRGSGHPYAARTINGTTLGRNDPYLGVDETSGKTVVDFGTTYNGSTMTGGWGAALKWSETVTRPMDIFIVERHNADMRPVVIDGAANNKSGDPAYRNQTLLGISDMNSPSLVPGNPAKGHDSVPILLSGSTISGTAKPNFRVDCGSEMNRTAACAYYPGYDQHVYSIFPTDAGYINGESNIPFDAFACERRKVYGGQTLGEVIVFTNLLTAAQRDTVNRYLTLKWKGATLAELTLEEGASVSIPSGITLSPTVFVDRGGTVTGGGKIAPVVAKTSNTLVATGGAVVDDPLLAADAWFHVDASMTNMFGWSSASPTNVYCWSDVRGRASTLGNDQPDDGGRYAWAHNSHPWIIPGYTNGLAVLDFGPGFKPNIGMDDWRKTSMKWSEACWSPRTFLIVVEDHPGMKDWLDNSETWKSRNQSFVGNVSPAGPVDNPAFPIFGRPNRANASVNSAYVLSDYGKKATFYLDGTKVDTPTTTAFPDGLHLVSIETDEEQVLKGNQPCNTFACERSNLYGGQRLAEVLVFSNRLSAAERTRYEGLLKAKWFAGSPLGNTLASVAVTNGASYELKYQSLTVTNSLSLGGTLKAAAVSAPAAITLTEPSVIDAPLALPSSVTVTFAGARWEGYRKQTVKVLGATSVSGASNLVGRIDPNPRRRMAILEVREDGLYATFLAPGTCILFR